MKLLELMFESFWHFVGFTILLTGIANFILYMWNTFWKYWSKGRLSQKTKP